MFIEDDIGFRPIEEKDLEKIRELRNDPTTWINLTDISHVTPEMQREWYERIGRSTDRAYFYVFKAEQIEDYPAWDEGAFLGIIRMDEIDRANRSCRVGADIVPAERGKGWGTKAYRAILRYCFDFLNCHRVWLCVLDNNDAGIALYKKSGFREEGRYREAIYRSGRYHDYVLMSILEGEYHGSPAV